MAGEEGFGERGEFTLLASLTFTRHEAQSRRRGRHSARFAVSQRLAPAVFEEIRIDFPGETGIWLRDRSNWPGWG